MAFGDPKFSLQLSKSKNWISRAIGFYRSPEWMVVTTAYHLARVRDPLERTVLEYRLTGSNERNAKVPSNLSQVDYIWWRLQEYFGISKDCPSYFQEKDLVEILNHLRFLYSR